MKYSFTAIPVADTPQAADGRFQYLLDTYVSECNKVVSTWLEFRNTDLDFKPDPQSKSVCDIFKHQLRSDRRFFGDFLGSPEPAPADILPGILTVESACARFVELARERLIFIVSREEFWWLTIVPFYDVERQRIWIFWRQVLHTAHHRTQLTVYLRLMGRDVPSTYGPTADVTGQSTDSANTLEAAGRK